MGPGFCDRSAQATRVRGRVPGWPALTPLRTLLVGGTLGRFPPHVLREHRRFHQPLKTASQRTNIKNPGWSPTTVMCPLQGEVSSNRNTLPGRSCLVSPSVVVIEKLPCKTMPN